MRGVVKVGGGGGGEVHQRASPPPPPTFIFLRVILHLHVYIYAIVSTQHTVTPPADAVRVILNEFALATDVYSYNC